MPASRFFRRGFSKIYWLLNVASASAGTGFNYVSPTSAELNNTGLYAPPSANAFDLSFMIQGITGLTLANTPIEVPDLASRYNKTISGVDTTPASSLDFYDDDANPTTSSAGLTEASPPSSNPLHAQDIRFLLTKGNTGYIALLPYGNVTGRRLEIWNVTTLGVNDQWSLTAEAGRFSVPLAVLDVPNQHGLTP